MPVILPRWDDPRLRLAAIITSLQVLGQIGLGFKVSIAQILISIAAAGGVEVGITYVQKRALIWPASALLTGNSVAFILRASGTHHGDWWSLNGFQYFVLASLSGLLSKYLIQINGRHLYNPSNLGLVIILLVVGPAHVYPQYLWWGSVGVPVVMALAVIAVGGLWILRPLRMLPMVAAFMITFDILIAALAGSGHCFAAAWHAGPICRSEYMLGILSSPELLVFVFFMISDPRTAPSVEPARVVYGIAIAALAAGLILFQPTEYGIKVALLAALTMVCSIVPLMDWIWRRAQRHPDIPKVRERLALPEFRRLPAVQAAVAVLAATYIALAVPASVGALASNPQALAIDLAGSPAGSPHGGAPAQ